jgi:ABC-type sugar transport system substrate-binding protein
VSFQDLDTQIGDNAQMGDEHLRSEIRDEQERIISAVRSATDHWEMAKAEDSFADLLERMADELDVGSARDRGRFLAAAHALRQAAAANEHRYVTGLGAAPDDA